ncbi:double PHD fingers d4 isoform X1 [Rhipicephalus microplus]|uniref:double PHD fingers d4 isoform X1 n=1 Tax=Rhipicephalus microplus TaxID=6941 RepID=UPI003F6CDED6
MHGEAAIMSLGPLKINSVALNRLKAFLNEPAYKDATESSSVCNTRLVVERRLRLPFLDAQTGVAQSDCALWMARWQRMPGHTEGQLYSYPARRWRKRRRQYLMNDRYLGATRLREPAPEYGDADMHQISVVENVAARPAEGIDEAGDKAPVGGEDSNQSWYLDEVQESAAALLEATAVADFPDDPETDTEDYDETYTRKKKKKPKNAGQKKRTRIEYSDAEKPYSCEICGVRYKTRPGLSYHYAHSHIASSSGTSSTATSAPADHHPPPAATQQEDSSSSAPSGGEFGGSRGGPASGDSPLAGLRKFQDSFLSFLKTPQGAPTAEDIGAPAPLQPPPPQPQGRSASGKPLANPSPYCDFCLGDNGENKKTRQPEELVSCSDCGRSAHPSCLQFTPNMTVSVKKYRWQCIECKSCGLCGTSDNDDQLLFCDDCDRGYHMYCLQPPLSEPPEGLWSCHLCVEEYGRVEHRPSTAGNSP